MSEHHSVVIVGGGPGGLGVAALLAGWTPRLASSPAPDGVPGWLMARLADHAGDLLGLDLGEVAANGINPGDLYRWLHHPRTSGPMPDGGVLRFQRNGGADWLLVTSGQPGGLWNGVPRHQLTLSPARWMELAAYPIGRFAADAGRGIDPGELILKDDLVAYYHDVPRKLGIGDRIRTGMHVTAIRPATGGEANGAAGGKARPRFVVEGVGTADNRRFEISSEYLVFAPGPRSRLRRLGVPGEDLPFVSHHYDHVGDFPGGVVAVIGGGRSSDWAATELHDAGKRVVYVMRQQRVLQERLINESLHLPYYRRLRAIIDSGSELLDRRFEHSVTGFEPGFVLVQSASGPQALRVDHAVIEIGGEPDYGLLGAFGPLTLVEKRDNYRFQLDQMAVHQHSGESLDIPGLYPAGYLVQGTGLSVIGFDGAAYPAAASIRKSLRQP